MAGHVKSMYASKPFKFIIEGNPFFIHADVVSLHSKPLDRLMNGHMIEAREQFAVIEDVDEGTFDRFIQWAYKGCYTSAGFEIEVHVLEEVDEVKATAQFTSPDMFEEEPVTVPEAVSVEEEPVPDAVAEAVPVADEAYDHWGTPKRDGVIRKSKKGKRAVSFYYEQAPERSSKDALKEMFIKRKTKVRQESIAIPPPRPNQDLHEDYTKVFLSHAQLHVFADKYGIKPLKELALENLQETLAIFNLYRQRTGDIVELLRYVYANTGESKRGKEDLRTLMTHYIGFEIDTLMKDEGFKDLMIEDGGALLGDFMSMVGKRI